MRGIKKSGERKSSLRYFIPNQRRSQVWIETVIYTLIALILIGAVLAFVKPKIEELQDKAVTEQSIIIMKEIDSLIKDVVQGGPGNKRKIELGIKKGRLEINGVEDKIFFELESRYAYSEPGKPVSDGNVDIFTEEKGKDNLITLTVDYSDDRNITYNDRDEIKTLSKASISYLLYVSNKGEDERTIIDIKAD